MKHRFSKRSGLTMVEVLTASALSVMLVFTTLAVFLEGMSSWTRGQGRISAETQSQQAVRKISDELREAMSVTVEAGGNGVTYQRPMKDSNGDFLVPPTWDNVNRRIYYSDGRLMIQSGATSRVFVQNVILTDPKSTGGSTAYKIFTPALGTTVRSLTVMIATLTNGAKDEHVTGRTREVVFLRNIPQLTK